MKPKEVSRDVKRLNPQVRNIAGGSVGGSKHPRTVGRDVQMDKGINKDLYRRSDQEDRGKC